jgi:hypothetical protein
VIWTDNTRFKRAVPLQKVSPGIIYAMAEMKSDLPMPGFGTRKDKYGYNS